MFAHGPLGRCWQLARLAAWASARQDRNPAVVAVAVLTEAAGWWLRVCAFAQAHEWGEARWARHLGEKDAALLSSPPTSIHNATK
jgi:hypothetical protein